MIGSFPYPCRVTFWPQFGEPAQAEFPECIASRLRFARRFASTVPGTRPRQRNVRRNHSGHRRSAATVAPGATYGLTGTSRTAFNGLALIDVTGGCLTRLTTVGTHFVVVLSACCVGR